MRKLRIISALCICLLTLSMLWACKDRRPDEPKKEFSEGLVYTSNGDGTCLVSEIGDCKDVEIIIPATSPDGETVVGIGDEAFAECTYVTSVKLPDTVTSIGKYAFSCCLSLGSIRLPDAVRTVGESAFIECRALESINIPEGIAAIEKSCFEGCVNLVSITIPSSVTSIGDFAFMSCSSLVEIINKSSLDIKAEFNMKHYLGSHALQVIFDESESRLKRIGDCVFYDDGSRVLLVKYLGVDCEVDLPAYTDGKEYQIHHFAFHRNPYVTKVKIPEGVTEIRNSAFENCLMLTSVTVPSSVTVIDESAFSVCSLTEVINKSSVSISGVDNVITDESKSCLVRVGDYVFYDDEDGVSLVKYLGREKNVTLPEYNGGENYVISEWTFVSDWSAAGLSLESVTVPDSVTAIETYAFGSCNALKDVRVGNDVREIAKGAFSGCIHVENIWLGDSVSKVDSALLTESRELLSITVSEGNPNYKSVGGNLLSKDGKNFIRYAVGKDDTTLIIPKGVTNIAKKAVQGGRNLITVILPEGVTAIGERAFYGCGGITKLVLPKSLETVGNMAFINLAPEQSDGGAVHKVYYTGTEEEYKALRRNNLKYQHGLPFMANYNYIYEE